MGLPVSFPQPTVAPEGGLSGGEVAAIVILLTLAAIVAVAVGIFVTLYFLRRSRKYRIGTDGVSNIYLSDADSFNRETVPQEQHQLLESQTMAMMSKDDTLPAASLIIAVNEAALEKKEKPKKLWKQKISIKIPKH